VEVKIKTTDNAIFPNLILADPLRSGW